MFLWLVVAIKQEISQNIKDDAVFKPFDASNQSTESWTTLHNNNIITKEKKATISIEFYGNELWLIGILKKPGSIMDIKIDDMDPKEIEYNSSFNDLNILYHKKVPLGYHILVVLTRSVDIELKGIYYCIGHRYLSKEKLLQDKSDRMTLDYSLNSGNSLIYRFKSDHLWLIGTFDERINNFSLWIDDQKHSLKLDRMKASSDRQVILDIKLDYGEHIIKIEKTDLISGLIINQSKAAHLDRIGTNDAKLMASYTDYKFIPHTDTNIIYDGGIQGKKWTNETSGAYTNTNKAFLTYTFTGSRIAVMGYTNSWSGKMNIYIDNSLVANINNNMQQDLKNAFRYQSEYLEYLSHTIKIENNVTAKTSLGFHGFYVLDNGGAGVVEVDAITKSVNKGNKASIGLVRKGGSVGQLSVNVAIVEGKEFRNTRYIDFPETTVTFEEGDTTKEFVIETVYVINNQASNIIKFKIVSSTTNLGVGDNAACTITLVAGDKPKSCYIFAKYTELDISKTGSNWKTQETGIYSEGAGTISFPFSGCQATIIGYKNHWSTEAKVSIDGGSDIVMSLAQAEQSTNEILYKSDALTMGKHTVKLTASGSFGFHGLRYYDNGVGSIVVSSNALSVNKGLKTEVILNRVGGESGELTVEIGTESDTAVDGKNYFGISKQSVTFIDGDTSKKYEIQSIYIQGEAASALTFKFKLFSSQTYAGVGTKSVCTITLNDITPPALGFTYIGYPLFTYTGSGWAEDTDSSGKKTEVANDFTEASFTGNSFWITGYKQSSAGTVSMTVDTDAVVTIDTSDGATDTLEKNKLLYKSGHILNSQHTMKLENAEAKLFGLNGVYVFNDNGEGFPAIEQSAYEMERGETIKVRIKRYDGATGAFSINIETKAITAQSGKDYTAISKTLQFTDGLTFIDVDVTSLKYYLPVERNFTFSLNIISTTAVAGVGEPSSAIITIYGEADPSHKFTVSSYFKPSKDFSLTHQFSRTSTFTLTKDFTATKLFKDSVIFSSSKDFKASNLFLASIKFSETSIFSLTRDFKVTSRFSITSSFPQSKEFSVSSDFKASNLFLASVIFFDTSIFSLTKDFKFTSSFSITSSFHQSKEFSVSSDFEVSNVFSDTEGFSVTQNFIKSSEYSDSIVFSLTENFVHSKQYSGSDEFSISGKLIETDKFSKTGVLSESMQFQRSEEFSYSVFHQKSFVFSLSPELSPITSSEEDVVSSLKGEDLYKESSITKDDINVESSILKENDYVESSIINNDEHVESSEINDRENIKSSILREDLIRESSIIEGEEHIASSVNKEYIYIESSVIKDDYDASSINKEGDIIKSITKDDEQVESSELLNKDDVIATSENKYATEASNAITSEALNYKQESLNANVKESDTIITSEIKGDVNINSMLLTSEEKVVKDASQTKNDVDIKPNDSSIKNEYIDSSDHPHLESIIKIKNSSEIYEENDKQSIDDSNLNEPMETSIEHHVIVKQSENDDDSEQGKSKAGIIAGATVGAIIAIVVIVLLVLFFLVKRPKNYSSSSNSSMFGLDETEMSTNSVNSIDYTYGNSILIAETDEIASLEEKDESSYDYQYEEFMIPTDEIVFH